MVRDELIQTRAVQNGLIVEGSNFCLADQDGQSLWQASPLDKNRVLLYTKNSHQMFKGARSDIGRMAIPMLRSFLLSLIESRFTGSLVVDTGRGNKKIFFENGEIVFASSNLMDDRLGEVIYREDMINLDQLTDAAVKVTRTLKFGQVLLESGIFQPFTLWAALILQVRGILESIFLVNHVFYQLSEGGEPAPTQIRFPEGSQNVVEVASSKGQGFRSFLSRLSSETVIDVLEVGVDETVATKGTFEEDFISLIQTEKEISSLVRKSKLVDINTYKILFELVNRGVCKIVPDLLSDFVPPPGLHDLEKCVAKYEKLRKLSLKSFHEENKEAPFNQVKLFLNSLENRGGHLFALDRNCGLVKDSVLSVYNICTNNAFELSRAKMILESLIAFFLQMTQDSLSWEKGEMIKKAFFNNIV